MNKRISFLLPGMGEKPAGGYKVVYEYANRMVADGYDVSIIYPAYSFRYRQSALIRWLRMLKALIRFLLYGITGRYSCKTWFDLDERVRERWVYSLAERFVPVADVYVATAVRTSVYLNAYKQISNEQKYYFIQHFENWGEVTDEDVMQTYHYKIRKIVIANWLKRIVEECGESCELIPNGFDFSYFHITTPICQKSKYKVCMLYHLSEWKGCADGFKALTIVKENYPQLEVNLFGVPPRPEGLPDWYHYYQQPDQETHNRIYNEAALFVGPSWTEGWGLTVGEAMMCGCAVACTDNLGYMEMATDGETALLSPIKDVEALANNILRLIGDDELRYRIAENGYRNIQQFTWERAYSNVRELMG